MLLKEQCEESYVKGFSAGLKRAAERLTAAHEETQRDVQRAAEAILSPYALCAAQGQLDVKRACDLVWDEQEQKARFAACSSEGDDGNQRWLDKVCRTDEVQSEMPCRHSASTFSCPAGITDNGALFESMTIDETNRHPLPTIAGNRASPQLLFRKTHLSHANKISAFSSSPTPSPGASESAH